MSHGAPARGGAGLDALCVDAGLCRVESLPVHRCPTLARVWEVSHGPGRECGEVGTPRAGVLESSAPVGWRLGKIVQAANPSQGAHREAQA